ncbi:hypothetical protein Y032_0004g2074 [Ancylostoma ceylanicum]|uniref:Uncharacterized protein n=1 Tax=Ancylostoma ceylanicum TaxID=53326 RepID=A0A016VUK3_9BILA|nr:hypothetical protein Y032_0004g2074 [Ancylostoma ceylanicum]
MCDVVSVWNNYYISSSWICFTEVRMSSDRSAPPRPASPTGENQDTLLADVGAWGNVRYDLQSFKFENNTKLYAMEFTRIRSYIWTWQ